MASVIAKVRAWERNISRQIGQVFELRGFVFVVVLPVDLLQADDVDAKLADHRRDAGGIAAPVAPDRTVNVI